MEKEDNKMKRYIRSIEAMASINPRLCDQSTILIELEQRNEGPIPHLHVYHDKTRNPRKCSYVRLDTPEYSIHHGSKKVVPLPDDKKEEFIKIMNSPWPRMLIQFPDGTSRPSTGYEAAVNIWIDTYGDDYSKFNFDANGQIIPIDYSLL